MHLPFRMPRWAIISSLSLAGLVAAWALLFAGGGGEPHSSLSIAADGSPYLLDEGSGASPADTTPGAAGSSDAKPATDRETTPAYNGGKPEQGDKPASGSARLVSSVTGDAALPISYAPRGGGDPNVVPIQAPPVYPPPVYPPPVYPPVNTPPVSTPPVSWPPPTTPPTTTPPATTPPASRPATIPTIGGDSVPIIEPSFFAEEMLKPLPGAPSRGVAFSEWESYRTDVAGRDILVTTDDSNYYQDRNGKLNGNTGDTDASGLNVVDAVDSTIFGSESADFPPWAPAEPPDSDDDDDDDSANPPDTEDQSPETDDEGDETEDQEIAVTPMAMRGATAAVLKGPIVPLEEDSGNDSQDEGFDFPYREWIAHASRQFATSVHTDEGTTLASGADAFVIGADGYDDDDNRAAGEHITITRDDGNVIVGGTGDVNAQIGDSEQGAVIMNVRNTFIKGGGAY